MIIRMLAAIDESYASHSRGVYAVGAVVLSPRQRKELRKIARDLRLPGQQRLHHHDERAERRQAVIEKIGGLDLKAVVAVATPVSNRKQDRARERCLLSLTQALTDTGVGELIIESRSERNDRHDRATITGAQRSGSIPQNVSYGFRRPGDEPLLWLADFVVGAITADYRLGGHGEVPALGRVLTVMHVPP